MGFASFNIGLQSYVEWDDDTESSVLRKSECPWIFKQHDILGCKMFVPDSSSTLYWTFVGALNFQRYADLGNYSFGTTNDDFTANGISFKGTFEDDPYVEDATTRSFSFRMPAEAILLGLSSSGGSYNSIPIDLVIKGKFKSGETTYDTQINAKLYISLTKSSLTIESTSYYSAIFVGGIGASSLGGVTYTDDKSFKTLPDFESPKLYIIKPGALTTGAYNEIICKLSIDKTVVDFLAEGDKIPIHCGDNLNFATISSISSNDIKVSILYRPNEITKKAVIAIAYNNFIYVNPSSVVATFSVGTGDIISQTILCKNSNDIEATEFIEDDSDQLLFQKGGRVWCTEFVEQSDQGIQFKRDYSIIANNFVEV